MKISKLIQRLAEVLQVEGDIDVICWPHNHEEKRHEVEEVDVYDDYYLTGRRRRVVCIYT